VICSKLTICGVARNAGVGLEPTLSRIAEFMNVVADSSCFIVTNDNTDDTARVIHDWARDSEQRFVLTLDGLIDSCAVREDRLAIARNSYLLNVMSRGVVDDELLIVMDLDGPNCDINVSDIIKAVARAGNGWDALFANQQDAYYDIFALRHPIWSPGDCWAEVNEATTFPFRNRKKIRAIKQMIGRRQFKIPTNSPLIRVQSAFGGLGIYRANALKCSWYGSRSEDGSLQCEHVALHRSMIRRGAKLFIAPEILNLAPTEHLVAGCGQLFPKEFLSQANNNAMPYPF
jgi:hypothetical protein